MGFLLNFFSAALLTLLFLLHTRLGLATNDEATKHCIERERKALLLFKQGIYHDSDMLSTWRNADDEDCCNWKGVHCSKKTGHVQILDLRGPYPVYYLAGTINITLLVELHDLKHLDLSYNAFYQSDIPKSIESFTNLRYLNLSYSGFVGSIPNQLGKLSNLRYIDLSMNRLDGAIPWQIGNLSKLQYLNLRDNSLVGVIPYQLGNLSMLHTLQLGDNMNLTVANQNDRDEEWISKLSLLTNLDLSYVSDVGYSHIWLQVMIGKLVPKLRELRLAGCDISYAYNLPLSASPSNYSSSLVTLDLSSNNLSSSLFQWTFNFSSSLQNLYLLNSNLSSNDLYFLFSHSHFPSLIVLDLSFNKLNSLLFQWPFNFSSSLQNHYLQNCNISSNDLYFLFSHSHFPSLIVLDLSDNNLNSSLFQWPFNFSSSLQNLYLQNCSLSSNDLYFLFSHSHFPSLIVLALSYNNLTSVMPLNFGSNLQELYLQNCSLSSNNLVFTSFNPNLTSLVHLDLSQNLLTSSTIFYWISNFTFNLHEVHLYYNLLRGSIPNSFGNIMNSLQVLDLEFNKLQGEVLTSLGNICTLKSLSLGLNNLSGDLQSFIPNTSRCDRHPLKSLYLERNRLTGLLPNLSVFSFLQDLHLSDNQLRGKIPESIGLMSQLKYLHLDGNNLGGVITESHFRNLSNLLELSLSRNPLTMEISNSWIPPFQLQSMDMASCMIGPNFPNWLRNQHQLSSLDISNSNLSGFIPEWFWPWLKNIDYMNISNNNFVGRIPNVPLKFHFRPTIILTSNNFEGSIPSFFSQASELHLSKNKFSNLILLVCGQDEDGDIAFVDLSNNQLKGNLPNCWNQLDSLVFLDLSNNNLSGEIPSSIGRLVNMEALILRNNSLTGELPLSLVNCSKLLSLDISKNKLSGLIPSWIGVSLGQLQILSLRMNHLYGSLPVHLCHLTQIRLLDLSCNKLSSEIPSCFQNFSIMAQERINISRSYHQYRINATRYIYYKDLELFVTLMWKGADSMFMRPEFLLKSIDLSSNTLSGEIPKELVSLLGLVSLNLSRNQLSGKIPEEIGNLKSLEFLDLSKNDLDGLIPASLAQIDRLTMLDLSNNNLYGKIPEGTQLQGFNASCYKGNLDLCGLPLGKNCTEDETSSHQEYNHNEDDNSIFSQELYLSLGLGFFIGFWAFVGPLLFNRRWRQAYYGFLNRVTTKVQVMVEIYVNRYLTKRD